MLVMKASRRRLLPSRTTVLVQTFPKAVAKAGVSKQLIKTLLYSVTRRERIRGAQSLRQAKTGVETSK